MQKKELIKWLESLPDDAKIRIRDVSEKRDYPIEINNLNYPLYCDEYSYLDKEDYKSLSEEEKKEFEELAIIEIDTDS